jgi:hypothetical protein
MIENLPDLMTAVPFFMQSAVRRRWIEGEANESATNLTRRGAIVCTHRHIG